MKYYEVQVFDFSGGRRQVGYAKFDRLVNADLELQRTFDPWITVPKGKLSVRMLMVTSMESWAKYCTSAGMVF